MSSRVAVLILLVASTLLQANGKDYNAVALKAHNLFRQKHVATPALKLGNDTMKDLVLECAIRNSKKEVLEKCSDTLSRYGVNGYASGGHKSAEEASQAAVEFWYKSGELYDYGKPGTTPEANSFSQVVWKGSSNVACGAAKGKTEYFVFCIYTPRGNIKGAFQDNVSRPK